MYDKNTEMRTSFPLTECKQVRCYGVFVIWAPVIFGQESQWDLFDQQKTTYRSVSVLNVDAALRCLKCDTFENCKPIWAGTTIRGKGTVNQYVFLHAAAQFP